jgi:hypothetical protein
MNTVLLYPGWLKTHFIQQISLKKVGSRTVDEISKSGPDRKVRIQIPTLLLGVYFYYVNNQ